VSFTADERAKGKVQCNYREIESQHEELHGTSAFYKDAQGAVFHTYSAYARGLDLMVGTYNWLDIAPPAKEN